MDPITAIANAAGSMFSFLGDVTNGISGYFIAKEQGKTAEYLADRQLDIEKERTFRMEQLMGDVKNLILLFFAGLTVVAVVKSKSLTPIIALAMLLGLYWVYLHYVKK